MKWKKNSWQNWPRSPKRQSRIQRLTTTRVVLLVAGADLVVLTLLVVNRYRQNMSTYSLRTVRGQMLGVESPGLSEGIAT